MNNYLQADEKGAEEMFERLAHLSPAKRALLELRLKKSMNERLTNESIPARKEKDATPLSFAQQRLWFLNQLDPESPFYNICVAWRFKGALNTSALQQALNTLVDRHETLRTTFALFDGEPIQKITQSLALGLLVTDLSGFDAEVRESSLQKLCAEEARWVFDLEKGPLLRCSLFLLEADNNVLMLNIHHIVSDGWSMEILSRDLFELYSAISTGKTPSLPALPIQYADYAKWQRDWFQGAVLEKQLNYWKKQLSGAPLFLELPTDRPRPLVQGFQGSRQSVILPGGLLEDLKALSRRAGATLFMTLLAAFQLLLHRYSGQEDILVGSPIAGRNRVEVDNLIGFFVNTIILRTDFSGNPTFIELLRQVREVSLEAYEHQDLPFEKLVEELKPERSLGYSPLVQVLFALQNMDRGLPEVSDLSVSRESIDISTAKFDLILFMYEVDTELHALLEYNTDLFDPATIVRMIGHFGNLLKGIASDPAQRLSDIPWLDESEYHRIVTEWNRTRSGYPKDLCVHQVFEEQAARTPDSVAVVSGNDRLTYAQLNTKADQVAHYLRLHGVGPEKRVGICVERSVEMVVGLLGILKAGGAYVPLDPAYPLERLSFMMEDAQIEMLLTQKKLIHRLSEFTGPVVSLDSPRELDIQGLTDNLRHADSADRLAYVMYTSGSTGKPKGVAVVHRGIVRLVKETNYVNLTSDEVILQFAPISFDASTFEIWGALLNGARLVIFPDHLPSLKELGDVLKQYRITTLWLTAGLFHQMVSNHLEGLKPVRQLLAGGDVLSPNIVKKALETLDECRLINGYGPTENTTFTCCHVMTDSRQVGDTVPIGRPISNTQVYILDKHLKPVPVGVTGELFIGGDGLARGYLNQPELTKEKFISNPFSEAPESRLYRSGDLVRYRPDGLIEFLGRKDTQVKIRGFRIELGEIEAVLMIHSSVREVAVAVREDMHGDKRIAAYVVLKPGKSLNTEALRAFVMEKLPEYMVPSAFVLLDALPLTSNGKVDRKALPALSDDQERSGRTYQAPRDSLEIQLVKIWEKTLSRRNIGINDNFFDLGGHSLLAIQVVSQTKKYLGKEIAVADLFKHPDIEHLAAFMRSEGWSSRFSLLIPFQPLGPKPPFFCLHGAVAEAANLIGLEQPFFGGFPHGFFGGRIPASVEEMAVEYLREIRIVQPEGPYYVGGYSLGGMVAFEVAQQLKRQGQKVALLVLIDATASSSSEKSLKPTKNNTGNTGGEWRLKGLRRYLTQVGKRFMELNAIEKIVYILKGVWRRIFVKTGIERKIKEYICRGCVSVGIPLSDSLRKFYRVYVFRRAARTYTTGKYYGHAVLFRTIKGKGNLHSYWTRHIETGLEIHDLPGGHFDIFEYPQVAMFSEKLKMCLEKAQNKAQE